MLANHCDTRGKNYFTMCGYRKILLVLHDSIINYFMSQRVLFVTCHMMKGVCGVFVRTLLRPVWS